MSKQAMKQARMACTYCGGHHDYLCPRIKAIHFYEGGMHSLIEFWPRWTLKAIFHRLVSWVIK